MIDLGAPPDWNPQHRLLAGLIADDARDPDDGRPRDGKLAGRDEWQDFWAGELSPRWSAIPVEGEWRRGTWHEGLAEKTGMSPRAISRALGEIAATGYEMRQPITDRDGKPVRDKRGRLVFAAKGHALRFVVPPLRPRPIPQRSPDPASNDGQRSPLLASNAPQSTPDPASNDPQWSPDPATIAPQRSPLLASKVAEIGDPIPSVSPQPLSPHKSQSPQPPLLAAVTGAEARPAGAEGESIDKGADNWRCRYAGCRTPEEPTSPGADYHDRCRHLADVRMRQDRRNGGEAA